MHKRNCRAFFFARDRLFARLVVVAVDEIHVRHCKLSKLPLVVKQQKGLWFFISTLSSLSLSLTHSLIQTPQTHTHTSTMFKLDIGPDPKEVSESAALTPLCEHQRANNVQSNNSCSDAIKSHLTSDPGCKAGSSAPTC